MMRNDKLMGKILKYYATLFKSAYYLTLIFPRTPLLSKVWATISLNSVSSSADILNFLAVSNPRPGVIGFRPYYGS